MLVHKPKTHIYEKIVRDKRGQSFRVCFEVAEIKGKMYGRILAMETVQLISGTSCSAKSRICMLASYAEKKNIRKSYSSITPIESPFFNRFEFLKSQMARAPSL